MFRFDNILEQWAEVYKPLSHQKGANAEQRSFYRIDTINGTNEFVQNYAHAPTPCMAYSTLVDASLVRAGNKKVSYRHDIYFLVKQDAPINNGRTIINDSLAATEAKYSGDELVQDLLAYLFALKDAAARTVNGNNTSPVTPAEKHAATLATDELKGLVGLQLDEAEWGTMPMKYNGWWICGLEIEQIVPRQLCVVEERYHQIEDENDNSSS